jgi:hypothetical protein
MRRGASPDKVGALIVEKDSLGLILSPSTVESGVFWAIPGDPPRRRSAGGFLPLRRLLRQREDGVAPVGGVYIA